MNRKALFFVACLALTASPCCRTAMGGEDVQGHGARFWYGGSRFQGRIRLHFVQSLHRDVHIVTAYSSCGCTSVDIVKSTLKTYEEGAIRAVFNTPTFLGSRSATITVIIDKPMPAEILLHVRGVIRGDVVFEPGSVQLGDVEQGTPVDAPFG